jgi:lysophospholipid acyltransferase (LPLAT)-like uncharacterized protein
MFADQEVPLSSNRNKTRRLTPGEIPLLPSTIAGAIRLLYSTCRVTILGGEYEEAALRHPQAIVTNWHFAFPTVVHHYRGRGAMVMVSRSRDGELAARVVQSLGFRTFRGSPGKGGSTALRQLIKQLMDGPGGGFIADGSQGPPLIAQKGILILARYTQAPLLPVSVAASPCWRFNSWDRTLLPKPFSRVVLAFGAPMQVDRDISADGLEAHRLDLQNTLNGLTLQAEKALE